MRSNDMKVFNLASGVSISNTFVSYTITNPVVLAGASSGKAMGVQQFDTLKILSQVTVGVSLTYVAIKVETSDDYNPDTGVGTWYQETSEAVSAGVATNSLEYHKFTATGPYRLLIPIKDRYIRLSHSGTGTITNETITLTAVVCSSAQSQL